MYPHQNINHCRVQILIEHVKGQGHVNLDICLACFFTQACEANKFALGLSSVLKVKFFLGGKRAIGSLKIQPNHHYALGTPEYFTRLDASCTHSSFIA